MWMVSPEIPKLSPGAGIEKMVTPTSNAEVAAMAQNKVGGVGAFLGSHPEILPTLGIVATVGITIWALRWLYDKTIGGK